MRSKSSKGFSFDFYEFLFIKDIFYVFLYIFHSFPSISIIYYLPLYLKFSMI
ncbi:hypothetical protein DRN50_05140 [Thermococci archaeon]|nr:MAG: hypothetical protein DRN50_05140 [Thermococci archaeon]